MRQVLGHSLEISRPFRAEVRSVRDEPRNDTACARRKIRRRRGIDQPGEHEWYVNIRALHFGRKRAEARSAARENNIRLESNQLFRQMRIVGEVTAPVAIFEPNILPFGKPFESS